MFQEDPIQDEWLEIEGRSRDDALERACNALNTTLPFLEYEVLGGNGTKIRARKLENPREPEPRRPEPVREQPPREAAPRPERGPEELPAVEDQEAPAEEKVPDVLLEEPSETGLQAGELLAGILRHIDGTADVELSETAEEVRLEIMGNGSGLFIGKRGATLEALQHLVAKMMGLDRRSGKRILVDSEHYRQRRQETLTGLARKLAGRARREGRPISVEPMNAVDRRILHLALKNDRHVTTKSVGEGADRKVVVVPRDFDGDVEESARHGIDERGGERGGGRRPPRGGRGRSRSGGNFERQGSGRGPERGRPSARKRPIPPGRMHDSFDVPSVPDDMFENDEDLMALDEQGMEGETPAPTTPEAPEESEKPETAETPETPEDER